MQWRCFPYLSGPAFPPATTPLPTSLLPPGAHSTAAMTHSKGSAIIIRTQSQKSALITNKHHCHELWDGPSLKTFESTSIPQHNIPPMSYSTFLLYGSHIWQLPFYVHLLPLGSFISKVLRASTAQVGRRPYPSSFQPLHFSPRCTSYWSILPPLLGIKSYLYCYFSELSIYSLICQYCADINVIAL